eukprot:gnl/MRDRNA2_/MRDRNA2_89106_c0_seq1.p1 gnl/MRDRNA2_/MRDRNA2_89106_c0~~gnl/MRDRNA2_/MRDRNA2_89106_c0_seq1.p1  ORF type:complete len:179 (-),score=47.54 gnl/MRDRNA2_/MRDRNA2_89106_c0_seq1:64-600(-)
MAAPPTAPAGQLALKAGPSADKSHLNWSLFTDAHKELNHLSQEVEFIRKTIQRNDEARRAEIQELDQDLEDECFERRDSFNRLKYEFESFAHRKVEKVLQELEEMECAQQGNDGAQQKQIDKLGQDLNRLKVNLAGIQNSWGRLVTVASDPSQKALTVDSTSARLASDDALPSASPDA